MSALPAAAEALVVGAGPAGLTAAIYLRRFERSVVLVDAGASRALRIPRARNYPGFPCGISGPQLLRRLRRQLAAAGGAVTPGRVTRLARDAQADLFEADCDGTLLRARRVLLATGVVDREPALAGLDAVRAAGRLRLCPICDGHEFRDRRIVVIGRDAHALREAEFLATFSARVTLVAPKGSAVASRDAAEGGAPAWWSHAGVALAIEDDEVVLRAADGASLCADVVYVALGVTPTSRLARDAGATLTESGTIRIDPRGQTSVPGLYAAGDVVDALDQLAVAAGQAAIAATAIHNDLRRSPGGDGGCQGASIGAG